MTRKGKRRENKRKNDESLGADWTFRQKVYGITKTTTTTTTMELLKQQQQHHQQQQRKECAVCGQRQSININAVLNK
jgi:hypothetical protein